jgi:hypothetical protein
VAVAPEENIDQVDKNKFKYISRNTIKYDDTDSMVCKKDEPDEENEIFNKTSLAYIEKQKKKLEREIEKNA